MATKLIDMEKAFHTIVGLSNFIKKVTPDDLRTLLCVSKKARNASQCEIERRNKKTKKQMKLNISYEASHKSLSLFTQQENVIYTYLIVKNIENQKLLKTYAYGNAEVFDWIIKEYEIYPEKKADLDKIQEHFIIPSKIVSSLNSLIKLGYTNIVKYICRKLEATYSKKAIASLFTNYHYVGETLLKTLNNDIIEWVSNEYIAPGYKNPYIKDEVVVDYILFQYIESSVKIDNVEMKYSNKLPDDNKHKFIYNLIKCVLSHNKLIEIQKFIKTVSKLFKYDIDYLEKLLIEYLNEKINELSIQKLLIIDTDIEVFKWLKEIGLEIQTLENAGSIILYLIERSNNNIESIDYKMQIYDIDIYNLSDNIIENVIKYYILNPHNFYNISKLTLDGINEEIIAENKRKKIMYLIDLVLKCCNFISFENIIEDSELTTVILNENLEDIVENLDYECIKYAIEELIIKNPIIINKIETINFLFSHYLTYNDLTTRALVIEYIIKNICANQLEGEITEDVIIDTTGMDYLKESFTLHFTICAEHNIFTEEEEIVLIDQLFDFNSVSNIERYKLIQCIVLYNKKTILRHMFQKYNTEIIKNHVSETIAEFKQYKLKEPMLKSLYEEFNCKDLIRNNIETIFKNTFEYGTIEMLEWIYNKFKIYITSNDNKENISILEKTVYPNNIYDNEIDNFYEHMKIKTKNNDRTQINHRMNCSNLKWAIENNEQTHILDHIKNHKEYYIFKALNSSFVLTEYMLKDVIKLTSEEFYKIVYKIIKNNELYFNIKYDILSYDAAFRKIYQIYDINKISYQLQKQIVAVYQTNTYNSINNTIILKRTLKNYDQILADI